MSLRYFSNVQVMDSLIYIFYSKVKMLAFSLAFSQNKPFNFPQYTWKSNFMRIQDQPGNFSKD